MSGTLSDWWWLQIVLMVIYLSDCVVWVPCNSLILERSCRRWRFRGPQHAFMMRDRVPVLVNPLTPWRVFFVLQPIPISVSPEGIALCACHELRPPPWPYAPVVTLDWSQVRGIWSEEEWVCVGGRVRAPSDTAAQVLASELRSIWKRPPEDRLAAIDAFHAQRCDPRRISAALHRAANDLTTLRFAVLGLFGALFVLLPLTIAAYTPAIPAVLWISLICWSTVLFSFCRAHQVHYPGEARARSRMLATMALMPPAALHAVTHLTRSALEQCDLAAVVLTLATPLSPEDTASVVIRDLAWPIRVGDEQADSVAAFARSRLVARLRRTFANYDAFLIVPERDSPDCLTYCPRCHVQYVIQSGECCHCPGVWLRRWDT